MAISPYVRGVLEGIAGDIINAQESATKEQYEQAQDDWRVKLTLGGETQPLLSSGILSPLKEGGGVIFPYTPTISVSYAANYDPTEVTHSNYKIFQYKNSAVDQITITATFTAQDTFEANYMLAVIHFFKTVTKMYYGQDENPLLGTPPPLCYLSGFGPYQFNDHPLVITNFTYTLPDKVDYIRAQVTSPDPISDDPSNIDEPKAPEEEKFSLRKAAVGLVRLGAAILVGGQPPPPKFTPPAIGKFADATYVPTEIQITISASPIVSRNAISNKFSLKDYATGRLTKEGIW